MGDTALLVVDVQTALIESGPFRAMETVKNIHSLIESARGSGAEIIYIRHDSGKAGFTAGCVGHEIHEAVAPKGGERIFDKRFNSAFLGTGLHGYLQDKGIKNIIIAGLQTEYCVDATCKAAYLCKPVVPNLLFIKRYELSRQKRSVVKGRVRPFRHVYHIAPLVLSHDGLKSILYP